MGTGNAENGETKTKRTGNDRSQGQKNRKTNDSAHDQITSSRSLVEEAVMDYEHSSSTAVSVHVFYTWIIVLALFLMSLYYLHSRGH